MAAGPRRALIAGESWIMHTIHQKGVDAFTTTAYGTGHQWLQGALEAGGWEVEHLPNHLAPEAFPTTMAELDGYDVVILSDIGSNSLLLSPDTFERSLSAPNRLALLRDWVAAGGGLIMVGGYLTFQGIEGKGRYAGSPVEDALPVLISPFDDRVERPEGVCPDGECARSPAGCWTARDLAGDSRLQPADSAAGGGDRGHGGRRPSARRLGFRAGAIGGFCLRLRTALGAAGIRRVGRLPDALAEHRQLGGWIARLTPRPRHVLVVVDAEP